MSTSSSSSSQIETLIPGLPDDLSALILSRLPIAHQSRLRSTSKSWHSFLSPSSLLPLRRLLRLPRHHLLSLFPSSSPSLSPPFLFDPLSLSFSPLPPLPLPPHLHSLSNSSPLFLFPHLYLLGGSHFDAFSFPLHHPLPSPHSRRLDLSQPSPSPSSWQPLPDMLSPRGSFACAAASGPTQSIYVAGGGSRHAMFPSNGTRTRSVEWFDVMKGEWRMEERMPRPRAGCVGFLVRREGEEEEFWVMGGYGEYRTVGGVVPADVYCRDAVALGLRSGKWREVGDMWEEGERRRLGKVGVVDGEDGKEPGVFMLDRNDIFRYDFSSNRWLKESSLCRKLPSDESCCFAAMYGELYVLSSSNSGKSPRKRSTIEIQVYNPRKREWRFLTTKFPFQRKIDFKTTISCTIQL